MRSWTVISLLARHSLCAALLGAAGINLAQTRPASTKSAADFTLTGSVVNSVSGEPIPRALVRISGTVQRTTFSDTQGRFEIEGLPRGSLDVRAQKPGYFSPRDIDEATPQTPVDIGGGVSSVLLKLVPQAAIYGRITDAAEQPIEHISVRLTGRVVREGRKRWQPGGFVQTDEDGRFRIGNLMPGTYYLAAGPGFEQNLLLVGEEKPKAGYATAYYPGVPDRLSAAPIQLSAGQQLQADFYLNVGPLFQLSGTVVGVSPDAGFSVQVLGASGDPLPVPVRLNPELGTFGTDGLPAGSYLLKAASQVAGQSLRAETRIDVAGNLSNIHLVLAPAISIPVRVRMESRAGDSNAGWRQGPPPLTVHLSAVEPPASDSYSIISRGNAAQYSMELQNLDPGKYVADLSPHSPWYVQSATYGESNLMYENLTVTGGRTYPIEIVMRDDSASVAGTVKAANGKDTGATIVALPQPPNRAGMRTSLAVPPGGFSLIGLAPGEYLIFAFDHAAGLEYADPDTLDAYASQAAHVTLAPGQESQVALTLIHRGAAE